MSLRGVTAVGTESRRSLYEMYEILRLSFAGERWEGIAVTGAGCCQRCFVIRAHLFNRRLVIWRQQLACTMQRKAPGQDHAGTDPLAHLRAQRHRVRRVLRRDLAELRKDGGETEPTASRLGDEDLLSDGGGREGAERPPTGVAETAGASISTSSSWNGSFEVECSASTASSSTAGTLLSSAVPCGGCDNREGLWLSVKLGNGRASMSRSKMADDDEWIELGEPGRDR